MNAYKLGTYFSMRTIR